MDEDFILIFALPDAVLFVGASLVGSVLYAINHRAARPVLWLTAGATAYAALLCIGLCVRGPGFGASTAMMTSAAVCVLVLAATARRDEPALPRVPFAVAGPGRRLPVWARAALQIVVFWSLFLGVLPLAIRWCEIRVGFPAMPSSLVVGLVMFASGGALGLWAGFHMARRGLGTPLPIDAAPNLVTSGPYAFVRNPMAIGGLLQGLAVAVSLGSWWIALYAILGGLIWDACVRPAEEAELRDRFGDRYDAYTGRVRCWWPKFGPRRGTAS